MKIPKSWTDYLLKIQETFPAAYIGGGCLRDLWLNKPIKDIDIFILNTNDDDIVEFIKNNNENNLIFTRDMKSYNGLSNSEVKRVITYPNQIDNLNVEFIMLDTDLFPIYKRFDFGICQIIYDGKEILFSGDFLNDIKNKTFTLVRCDNESQFERSIRRWDKFKIQFPEYNLNTERFVNYASGI